MGPMISTMSMSRLVGLHDHHVREAFVDNCCDFRLSRLSESK